MPQYTFQHDETGDVIDITYSMNAVPSIGDTIDHEGKQWRRLPPGDTRLIDPSLWSKYPYASIRNCANLPGAEHTPEGYSIIRSQRHEREFCARNNLERT